jgi:hypothetical protein
LHKSLHYTRGTGVKTYAKGGADAQLGEKQWMWRHLRSERASTSFQMRHSQGMTFPIALSTSPSSPSCVSAGQNPRSLTSICYEWVTSQHLPNRVMLQLCVVLFNDSLLRIPPIIWWENRFNTTEVKSTVQVSLIAVREGVVRQSVMSVPPRCRSLP